MNPWDFFETKLLINLPERFDKLCVALTTLAEQGIVPQVIPGIKLSNPMEGFNQAQWNALNACKGNSVIFEDDVTFGNTEHLWRALDELPEVWDILYLGANVVGTDLCSWPEPVKYADHLRRVTQAWTTHAVCYSQHGRDWILDNWEHNSGQMFDDYLRCNLEKLAAFITDPMICNQRPGYSDIWLRDVDYGFFNVWKQ